MSKIGIIWVGHQCEDMLERSLAPWIEARKSRLGGHDFLVCAASVPFEGFSQDGPQDDTVEKLLAHRVGGQIDHLISNLRMDGVDDDRKWKETEARGAALQWLVAQGCDITIQCDADEFYELDEISRILSFVEARPHVCAFRGSLKNYVEANGQRAYLADPFTPMRLHRVNHNGYTADSFWADNNVLYRGGITRDFRQDESFAAAQIPKSVAFTQHESWPNTLRSKNKIKYQLDGRGWGLCSFSWDDTKGGLIWNPSLPIPETEIDP